MTAQRSPQGHGQRRHLLDPEELRAARGFFMRAAIFVTYAVSPWLLGVRSGGDVATRLIGAFTMGGAFAMMIALMRGETAGRGRLNRWDEAMAFNGLSLLTHLLMPVFQHG